MTFESEAAAQLTDLRNRFNSYQAANNEKAIYRDGKYRMNDLKISIPPNIPIDTVVGWPGTVIDVLEERLDFEGWSSETGNMEAVYIQNDLDVKAPLVHSDALLFGTAFATVTTGEEGEPSPLVSVASPTEMVVVRDNRRGVVSAAARFIHDDRGELIAAVLFRPNETVWAEFTNAGWTITAVDEHRLNRVPVAQFINRARGSKMTGSSELTPALRGYTQSALRTLVGAEIAREFYAVPQRYMMGAPESFFLDENGNPRGAWDAMMGKILAVERDPETGDVPVVGSFAANAMTPFFEQLRTLSCLVAAEAAIPASYLGMVHDNPESGDAARMFENRLVKRAERRQVSFGKAWTEVARLAIMVRDGRAFNDLTDDELAIRPMWRDAATPTRAAAADEVLKMTQNQTYTPTGQYTLKRLGLSPQDRAMLMADHAKDSATALKRLMEGATQPPQEAIDLAKPVGDTVPNLVNMTQQNPPAE